MCLSDRKGAFLYLDLETGLVLFSTRFTTAKFTTTRTKACPPFTGRKPLTSTARRAWATALTRIPRAVVVATQLLRQLHLPPQPLAAVFKCGSNKLGVGPWIWVWLPHRRFFVKTSSQPFFRECHLLILLSSKGLFINDVTQVGGGG